MTIHVYQTQTGWRAEYRNLYCEAPTKREAFDNLKYFLRGC